MTTSEPSTSTVRAVITTFHVLAILTTSWRLARRTRTHRLGWDDAFAALALALDLIVLVAVWARTDTPGVGPLNQPKHVRIIAYWLATILFTVTLWAARLSMLMALLRIIPVQFRLHQVAKYSVWLFLAFPIALLAQKIPHCVQTAPQWTALDKPQCRLGADVGILEICTDIAGDAILIALPLRLLWSLSVSRAKYRLILAIFCASVFTTIVSIVHAVYVLGPSGLLEAITANVEVAVSLIVCNLALIVTSVYRALGLHKHDDEFFLTGQPNPRSSSDDGSIGHSNRHGRERDNNGNVQVGLGSALRFWRDESRSGLSTDTGTESRSGWMGRGGRAGGRSRSSINGVTVTVEMEMDAEIGIGSARSRGQDEFEEGDAGEHGVDRKGGVDTKRKDQRVEEESDVEWSAISPFGETKKGHKSQDGVHAVSLPEDRR